MTNINDLRNIIIDNLKKSKAMLNLKDFDQNLERKYNYLNVKLPFRTKFSWVIKILKFLPENLSLARLKILTQLMIPTQ